MLTTKRKKAGVQQHVNTNPDWDALFGDPSPAPPAEPQPERGKPYLGGPLNLPVFEFAFGDPEGSVVLVVRMEGKDEKEAYTRCRAMLVDYSSARSQEAGGGWYPQAFAFPGLVEAYFRFEPKATGIGDLVGICPSRNPKDQAVSKGDRKNFRKIFEKHQSSA